MLERAPPADVHFARDGETPTAEPEVGASVVVFRLGAERLALRGVCLREIVPAGRVRSIPQPPDPVVAGLVNVRGVLMIAADLRRLLGLPPGDDEPAAGRTRGQPRMLVLGRGVGSWVVHVDELLGIAWIGAAAVQPAPVSVVLAPTPWFEGVVEVLGASVGLLHHERLLAELASRVGGHGPAVSDPGAATAGHRP